MSAPSILGKAIEPAVCPGEDRLGRLAAASQRRHLISFRQAIHAAAQPVLIAVLAGTEIAAGADADAGQRLSAKKAGFRVHNRFSLTRNGRSGPVHRQVQQQNQLKLLHKYSSSFQKMRDQ
jgi:hypothetical protein